MNKLSSLISFFLIISASVLKSGEVHLVRNGQPIAEIVLAAEANPSMQNAARDLQEFVRQISGAELPIVPVPTDKFDNHIYAGAGEYTEKLGFEPASFTSSGYELLVRDNYIILSGYDRHSPHLPFGMTVAEHQYLRARGEKPEKFPSPQLQAWWDFCGEEFTTWQIGSFGRGRFNREVELYANDDTGTWYAAVELLEQLGVRFFAPYEDGTVVPSMENVSIPVQHTKKRAVFGRRDWYYSPERITDNIRWFKRQKSGNFTTIIYSHTTVAIYASVTQHQKHPEYLACDIDGKPFETSNYGTPPHAGGIPRYTNPDFRHASVVLMTKLFEASPELSAVALGAPDGWGKVDPRDLEIYGEPDDPFGQKAANYVWDYHRFLAEELKKTYPDKFLIYQAPGGAREFIPTNVRPDDPDNIIFGLSQSYSAYRVMEHVNRQVLDHRAKWFAVYKPRGKSPVWDYFLYYRYPKHPRFPVFFTEPLQREMQEMLPYSDGKFIELANARVSNEVKGPQATRICEPAITHLMICWQNQLLWDPDADRQAFLDDYYKNYFGPAAEPMKAFHEFAEQVWTRQESRSVTSTVGFLKPEDVSRYFELLNIARTSVEKDSVYDRRIAAMEEAYAPLKNFFASIRRKGPLVKAERVRNDITLEEFLGEQSAQWHKLYKSGDKGEIPTENITRIRLALTEDHKHFYLAAICNEQRMEHLRYETTIPDVASIFNDDLVELYINTPERSYFKIAVNPQGIIWDESFDLTLINRDTLALLWDPGTRAIARKSADRWEIALCVPTADFGKSMPTKSVPWGIQVGRSRMAGEKYESFRLSPSSGAYAVQSNWANLWLD